MGLVDYSESEVSEAEDKQAAGQAPKPATGTNKPAFQKVVDRSNPHKIRINLPESTRDAADNGKDEDQPPAKKARIGGGAFSGFNSFLPAPKRAGASTGALNGAGPRRRGLGSGVSLKTGSAPGFSRDSYPESIENSDKDVETVDGNGSFEGRGDTEDNISTTKEGIDDSKPPAMEKPTKEPKKQGNPIMFKPLSVARKPQKKKAIVANKDTAAKPTKTPPPTEPEAVPKVSLFATESLQIDHTNDLNSSTTYQPMLYGAPAPEAAPTSPPQADENPYIPDSTPSNDPPPQPNNPQSLSTIASDLNLSASAKRQLLGRQYQKINHNNKTTTPSAINIVNFNIDQEYAANELLRQAGEQVHHNPVRAIAPGKHSLKQLVNAASTQKDALEEQFASGRRNRKEAGSKYGW